mgnify:CR=1 FL=1
MSREITRHGIISFCIIVIGLTVPSIAVAAETQINQANTAWILIASALVLFMTLPGLALFYGGLVRANNILSVLMHCFAISCLMSVMWLVCVYSLAFTSGGAFNSYIGGFEKAFLLNLAPSTLVGDIPETIFFVFQMTFAIITPALIVGAFVERIKFSAVLIFSAIWIVLVYAPVCHWVWGGGWLYEKNIMDFAGGLVVHATAGVSALVIAAMLGPRLGYPRDLSPPHRPGLTMIGASMLWVGWFGFNGGSALSANGVAGMAVLVTHISAATASLTWMAIEWMKFGKPSLVGIVTGMVAGLAAITPGSGFVGPIGGVVYGLLAGGVCYYCVNFIKNILKIDDSLDVFAVHGVGGILGVILVSIFASTSLGGMGYADGMTMGRQLSVQVIGTVTIIAWSGILTFLIIKFTSALVGLRAGNEAEMEGLDLAEHGERGYN